MVDIYRRTLETPVGRLALVQEGDCLTRLTWTDEMALDETVLLAEAAAQLDAYFDRKLTLFDLPLRYLCSEFQATACATMAEIPYGETITYAEMARRMGTSAQSAGNACGGNPFPIIIPCHRVLATRGLGGYSGEGGIETKVSLLKLESPIPWLI